MLSRLEKLIFAAPLLLAASAVGFFPGSAHAQNRTVSIQRFALQGNGCPVGNQARASLQVQRGIQMLVVNFDQQGTNAFLVTTGARNCTMRFTLNAIGTTAGALGGGFAGPAPLLAPGGFAPPGTGFGPTGPGAGFAPGGFAPPAPAPGAGFAPPGGFAPAGPGAGFAPPGAFGPAAPPPGGFDGTGFGTGFSGGGFSGTSSTVGFSLNVIEAGVTFANRSGGGQLVVRSQSQVNGNTGQIQTVRLANSPQTRNQDANFRPNLTAVTNGAVEVATIVELQVQGNPNAAIRLNQLELEFTTNGGGTGGGNTGFRFDGREVPVDASGL